MTELENELLDIVSSLLLEIVKIIIAYNSNSDERLFKSIESARDAGVSVKDKIDSMKIPMENLCDDCDVANPKCNRCLGS
jgi:hypothetical protein